MGLFDFLKTKTSKDYSNVKNESLRAISTRFRGSKEDTVFVLTSRLCPTCSMYNRRVYSLFGRYESFPLLPEFLHGNICPTCGTHIRYSHYFPGANGDLKKDIKFSNQPFMDSRSSEEKHMWNERVAKEQLDLKMADDYKWICTNLPDLAPKSLGGYKRMISSKSANYKRIVSAAKSMGYSI